MKSLRVSCVVLVLELFSFWVALNPPPRPASPPDGPVPAEDVHINALMKQLVPEVISADAPSFSFLVTGLHGAKIRVTVSAQLEEDVPEPPVIEPDQPAEPVDPPVNPEANSALSAKVRKWLADVKSPTKEKDRYQLAMAFKLMAFYITKGKLTETQQIIDWTLEADGVALEETKVFWKKDFMDKLGATLEAMEKAAPDNQLDHATLWREIALTLEKGLPTEHGYGRGPKNIRIPDYEGRDQIPAAD